LSHPRPLFVATVPVGAEALNVRLKDALLAMKSSVPDEGSHRASGQSYFENKWLSPNRLHESDSPVFQELAGTISALAGRFAGRPLQIASMWSIVSKEGMEGKAHAHQGAVSIAYYVDPGTSGEEAGGLMQFFANGPDKEPTHRVVPQAGMLILFPSRLQHSVSRYTGDRPRIVISANLV